MASAAAGELHFSLEELSLIGKVRRCLHRELHAKQRRVLELFGEAAAVSDVYTDLVTLHAACRTLQADIERVDLALRDPRAMSLLGASPPRTPTS